MLISFCLCKLLFLFSSTLFFLVFYVISLAFALISWIIRLYEPLLHGQSICEDKSFYFFVSCYPSYVRKIEQIASIDKACTLLLSSIFVIVIPAQGLCSPYNFFIEYLFFVLSMLMSQVPVDYSHT